MIRKQRKIGDRVQLVVDELCHLLGHSSNASADVARVRSLQLTKLEERVLMSASPMAMVAEVATVMADSSPEAAIFDMSASVSPFDVSAADSPFTTDAANIDGTSKNIATNDASNVTPAQHGIELIVIDYRVQDADTLLFELLNTDRDFRILRLDSDTDGISQITEKLEQVGNVSAIHLLTHGRDGEILLGSTRLNASTLAQNAPELLAWQHRLTSGADLLLYGCDVAETVEGRDFVDSLRNLTGADVASSSDATGSALFGGDWTLEYQTGLVSTAVLTNVSQDGNWQDVLGVLTVTTTADLVDGNTSSVAALLGNAGADGFISLREAIIATNNTIGADTIFLTAGTFSFSIAGQGENAAATGDLDILDTLTINGAGAGLSIIDASGLDRVLEVRAGTSATISDVTIRGGTMSASNWGGGILIDNGATLNLSRVVVTGNSTGSGAGIYNYGTLIAADTVISNNSASDWGGGLYNDRGNVTLNGVTISGNTAGKDGGGINNAGSGAVLSLTNVTLSTNTAAGSGGGLWTSRGVAATNVTIANNVASGGDGVFGQGGSALVTFKNSLLYNPAGANSNRAMTSLGNNIDSDGTAALTGSGDLVADPQLAALANYGGMTPTHALFAGSPAINAGTSVGAPATDQRGASRLGAPDIGAFEYTVIGYEPFNYATGSFNGANGGSGWAAGWSSGGSSTTIAATGLQDPLAAMPASGAAAMLTIPFAFASITQTRDLTTTLGTPSTTTWLSFLIKPNSMLPGDYLGIQFGGPSANRAFVGYNGNAFLLEQVGGAGRVTVSGITPSTGQTYLLTVKIDFTAGADSMTLYVNTTPGLSGPDSAFTATKNNLDLGTFTQVGLNGGRLLFDNASQLDELRIGSNYIDVAPANAANTPPVIMSDGGGGTSAINVAENLTAVTTVTATDADLQAQTLTYSISGGADAAKFTINSSTGALRFVTAPNYEAPTDAGTNNVYDVTVQVSDGSLIDTQAIAVTVTPVNDNTPIIKSNGGLPTAAISVNENTTAVTTVTATDADLPAQTLTYSISGGADAAKFTINGSTGVLSFLVAPNFTSPTDVGGNNIYDLTVQVTDGALTDTQAIAVLVTATTALPTPAIWFSTNVASSAGGLAWNDGSIVELADPNLSLSPGVTSATFYNTQFNVALFAQDGLANLNGFHYVSKTVTVGSANAVTLQRGDILLSTATSETLGGVAVLAWDIVRFHPTTFGDFSSGAFSVLLQSPMRTSITRDFALVENTTVVGGVTLNPGDFLMTSSNAAYKKDVWRYQVADVGPGTTSGTLTELIDGSSAGIGFAQDVYGIELIQSNETIGGASLTPGQLLISLAASDIVGNNNLSVTGYDIFILNVTATGTGTSSGNASLLVRGSDLGLSTAGQAYDGIAVCPAAPLNMAPTIASNGGGANAAVSIAENTTAITTVIATDADLPVQTLTHSITGGADAAKFTINASTGVLGFLAAPNYEIPTDAGTNNVYDVIVQVSDGSLTDTQAIAVTINNVNEAPSMAISQVVSTVPENANTTAAITIATVAIRDDALGMNTLTLSGADAAQFQIVGGSLRLRAGTALDADTKPTLTVTMNLTDTSLSATPISSQGVTLNIGNIDEPPTANAGGPYTISEGDSLTVVAGPAVDPEGLALNFAWDIDGNGIFTDATGSTATLSWNQLKSLATPVSDNVIRTVALRVTDAGGNSTIATTTLTINNTAPTVNVTGNATASSGIPYTINLASSDPGADTISTYAINWGDGSTQTVSGTATSATHTYSVPGGTRSITVSAIDEDGTFPMNGGPLVVTVQNTTPSIPTLSHLVVPGLTNGAVVGTLSFTDPDFGDSHTWTVSDNRFTVVGSFLKLKSGQQLNPVTEPTVAIIVTVTDSSGASNSSSFSLRVNNPPISVADSYAVDGTRQLSISSPSVGVLANDSDADGNPLTASLVNGPSHAATFGLNANGSFWYRASAGFSGTDTFRYQATDGENVGAVTTVTFTVNQPASLSYTALISSIPEHQTLTSPLRVGTVNVTDDGIGTNMITLAGPDAALFGLDANNNLSLKSGLSIDFSVQTQFKVTVLLDDPAIAGSPDSRRTLIVSVQDLNEAPTATALSDIIVLEDSAPGTINTAAAFLDADGDPLSYSVQVVAPSPGLIRTISINQSTGVISYSLNANANGTATIRVTARDPSLATVSSAFQLTVQPVNDAPVAQNYLNTVNIDKSLTVSTPGITASVTDVDGNPVTVALVVGPTNGTVVLQANGSFVYTPAAGFLGIDTFRYVASDGVLVSNVGIATINVIPQFIGQSTGTSGNSSRLGSQASTTTTTGSSSTATASNSHSTGTSTTVNSGTTTSTSTTATTTATTNTAASSNDVLTSNNSAFGVSVSPAETTDRKDDEVYGILPTNAPDNIVRFGGVAVTTTSTDSNRLIGNEFMRRTFGVTERHDYDRVFSQSTTNDEMTQLNAQRESLYRELSARVVEQSDSVAEQLENSTHFKGRVVGSVGVVTTGFSVGYLFWAIRGGMLVSGLLAQVPAWTMLDPLLVIDGDQKDEDKESLQNLMDRQQAKMKRNEDTADNPVPSDGKIEA